MKVKQADGTEIEVFSQEELDQKLAAEKAAADAKAAADKAALDKALADKAELEAKIAAAGNGGGGDNPNFKTLKEALDKKDADIKALRDSNQKSEALRLGDLKSESVVRYAGADEELKKKILHHYDVTLASVKAETKEEIAKKMESAARLSMDTNRVDMVSQANFSGGGPGAGGFGGTGNGGKAPVEFSPAQKELGKKLGITDEDIKKYGPRVQ